MKVTKSQQDALLFAITQIEGEIEAAEDEDYITAARKALKELYRIYNSTTTPCADCPFINQDCVYCHTCKYY